VLELFCLGLDLNADLGSVIAGLILEFLDAFPEMAILAIKLAF